MDDGEVARRSLDRQARARAYRIIDVPGYRAWSSRKLREGESDALIAHLDATSLSLLPEELDGYTEKDFEQMLRDLREELGWSDDGPSEEPPQAQ